MTGTRTAPAVETPLAPTPKPKSAKKKDAALESDSLGSSADINAFLQMLPFNATPGARRVAGYGLCKSGTLGALLERVF